MIRRAVYTAVIGGYEGSLAAPPDSEVDYICFTDSPELTSERWQVELVEPRFPMDPVRSARALKIVGHDLLADYDQTLWVDNRVELLADPALVLDRWLADDVDIAMPLHSYREQVIDEFAAVLHGGLDEPFRVYEQLFHYGQANRDVLEQRPYWTALLARRSAATVEHAMRVWLDQVLRYSRRDQLSINLAITTAAPAVRALDIDNFDSAVHRWRTFDEASRVDPARFSRDAIYAMLPQEAVRRDLDQDLARQLAEATAYREATEGLANELGEAERGRRALAETAAALQAETARLQAESAQLRDEMTGRDDHIAQLTGQRSEMLRSTSWRVTAPLRRLTGLARQKGRSTR